MVRTLQWRRTCGTLLLVLAVAAAYYATGRLGLLRQVSVGGAVVTPLWPPTGIALAALLKFGPRVWPGFAIGTYLAIEQLAAFQPADLGIVAGNVLAPLCAFLLLRAAGFRPELDRLRDGLALVFLGGLLPMLISATAGSWTLVLTGNLSSGGFWPTWAAWWAGDTMGVLLVTPVLLALHWAPLPRDPLRVAEAAALTVATIVATVAVTHSTMSLLFVVFPLLIWAAVRFQLAGAAPCALLVSVLAIWAATDHAGPFTGQSLLETMVNLQALNGAAALTGLLLAALVAEQNNVRLKIEEACEELAEVVAHLSPGRGDEDPAGRP
ncbi:MASE1 domain-containing protein [Streptomyces sp. NPDC127069]|uniref:MASE1 domain-containing protein n=1 Tax=Streptomyces sp. NPDC127069 TaxID=3347128 RepID=UPI003658A528